MEKQDLPFQKILFVCVNNRENGELACSARGSKAIQEHLKQIAKDRGLKGKVRVSQSGCMDLCAKGPNVMVFPDNVWYSGVTESDIPKIVEAHLPTEAKGS